MFNLLGLSRNIRCLLTGNLYSRMFKLCQLGFHQWWQKKISAFHCLCVRGCCVFCACGWINIWFAKLRAAGHNDSLIFEVSPSGSKTVGFQICHVLTAGSEKQSCRGKKRENTGGNTDHWELKHHVIETTRTTTCGGQSRHVCNHATTHGGGAHSVLLQFKVNQSNQVKRC